MMHFTIRLKYTLPHYDSVSGNYLFALIMIMLLFDEDMVYYPKGRHDVRDPYIVKDYFYGVVM